MLIVFVRTQENPLAIGEKLDFVDAVPRIPNARRVWDSDLSCWRCEDDECSRVSDHPDPVRVLSGTRAEPSYGLRGQRTRCRDEHTGEPGFAVARLMPALHQLARQTQLFSPLLLRRVRLAPWPVSSLQGLRPERRGHVEAACSNTANLLPAPPEGAWRRSRPDVIAISLLRRMNFRNWYALDGGQATTASSFK